MEKFKIDRANQNETIYLLHRIDTNNEDTVVYIFRKRTQFQYYLLAVAGITGKELWESFADFACYDRHTFERTGITYAIETHQLIEYDEDNPQYIQSD